MKHSHMAHTLAGAPYIFVVCIITFARTTYVLFLVSGAARVNLRVQFIVLVFRAFPLPFFILFFCTPTHASSMSRAKSFEAVDFLKGCKSNLCSLS